MEQLLDNVYFSVIAHYAVAGLSIIIFLALFEWVTRYKAWHEIQSGNVAVALAVGGKILGVANIFRFSIIHHNTIWTSMLWGAIGFVLLLIAYFLFEFLTPKFNVDKELEKGNIAVGVISMAISLGMSFVIGASISQ